ncbi:MAG: GNAT family N-acetyltransferase [Limnochordia bacterium]|nr:GNAT family N-acetyltransferase [Limnochordia bacterium]
MQLSNNKVILRDFIESDIEDRIRWETVETEWQLWDAPWENEGGETFDHKAYRLARLEWLASEKDENRPRWGFQICINDEEQRHIGWCNAYNIDDGHKYTNGEGHLTIGIDIPDQAARQKGYATAAWDLFIRYFLGQGVDSIYTQTCQLNMPQYLENRKAWKHH